MSSEDAAQEAMMKILDTRTMGQFRALAQDIRNIEDLISREEDRLKKLRDENDGASSGRSDAGIGSTLTMGVSNANSGGRSGGGGNRR